MRVISSDKRRSTFESTLILTFSGRHQKNGPERKLKLQQFCPNGRLYNMTMAVTSACPRIYIGRLRSRRVTFAGRFAAMAVLLGCLGLLITASTLSPSSDGFGTHRQLGLAECSWLQRTNLPCPACGMTTSFAWFMRGNLAASFYVQPMGMVLAMGCGLTVWAAGYIAVTGHPVYRVLTRVPEKYYLIPLLCLAIAAWGWKMYIHLHGMDGWR